MLDRFSPSFSSQRFDERELQGGDEVITVSREPRVRLFLNNEDEVLWFPRGLFISCPRETDFCSGFPTWEYVDLKNLSTGH